MKLQRSISFIIATLLAVFGNIVLGELVHSTLRAEEKVQFVCSQSYDNISGTYVPSTLAWNPNNKKPIVIWKSEDHSGNGFPPQKRCEEISPRFQAAYDNGSLKYITSGIMNGQPVICTARLVGDDCATLLITLRHQDNAKRTLHQLSDILLGYTDAPLEQSSGDLVYYEDDRIYIEVDIEEFLSQP